MENVAEITEAELQPSEKTPSELIPPALKEFGEIPSGFVSVYIQVPREKLTLYDKYGARKEDIESIRENSFFDDREKIFSEERVKAGQQVDRTSCVFAYPRHPKHIRGGLEFNPDEDVVVEAKIDPKTAIVVDGDYVGEASRYYNDKNAGLPTFGGIETVRRWAKGYWKEAKPLLQYLEERHNSSEYDYTEDFSFPEVLIPDNIPPSRLRVVTSKPGNPK